MIAVDPAEVMSFGEAIIVAVAAMPVRIEIDCAGFVQPSFFWRRADLEADGIAVEHVAMIAAGELGKTGADDFVSIIV